MGASEIVLHGALRILIEIITKVSTRLLFHQQQQQIHFSLLLRCTKSKCKQDADKGARLFLLWGWWVVAAIIVRCALSSTDRPTTMRSLGRK
jgi:hypothetical protein